MARVMIRGLAAAAILAAGAVALADTIELKDGRKFTGQVSIQGERVVITTDDGATLETTKGNLLGVKQVGKLTTDELAEVEWKRVAAQVRKSENLHEIITVHEKFIRQYPEAKITQTVTAALDKYRKVGDEGGVKYHGDWMSQSQFAALKKSWSNAALPALTFYRAGQTREALDAAKIALTKDALNPDAMTVAGLAAYRSNNMQVAIRYFTSLVEAIPSDGLAENNLGALYFQQRQLKQGLSHYAKALQIMPGNRLLLDNIAEAVHAWTDDKDMAYRSLMRLYDQAQAKKEAEMAKDNQHRWGSTWVSEAQFEKLMKGLTTIKEEMAQLDAGYQAATTMLPQIEMQIRAAEQDIQKYLNDVANMEVQGVVLPRGSNPGTYNSQLAAIQSARAAAMSNLENARTRKAALETQRAQLWASVQQFRVKAKDLKSQLDAAQPQYTGIHRMMELGDAETPPPPAALGVAPDIAASRKEQIK